MTLVLVDNSYNTVFTTADDKKKGRKKEKSHTPPRPVAKGCTEAMLAACIASVAFLVLAVLHVWAVQGSSDVYITYLKLTWSPPGGAEQLVRGLHGAHDENGLVEYIDHAFTTAMHLTGALMVFLIACHVWRGRSRWVWLPCLYGVLDVLVNIGAAVTLASKNKMHKPAPKAIFRVWLPVLAGRITLLGVMLWKIIVAPPQTQAAKKKRA